MEPIIVTNKDISEESLKAYRFLASVNNQIQKIFADTIIGHIKVRYDPHTGMAERSCFNPLQYIDEMSYVLDTIRPHKPKFLLEIGLGFGGSHVLFKSVSKNVISVDSNWDKVCFVAYLLTQFKMIDNSFFITADSSTTAVIDGLLEILENDFLDVLFIDGGHTYDNVMCDYVNHERLVKSGGLIFFHDCYDPQVHKAILEINPPEIKFIKGNHGHGCSCAYYTKI